MLYDKLCFHRLQSFTEYLRQFWFSCEISLISIFKESFATIGKIFFWVGGLGAGL